MQDDIVSELCDSLRSEAEEHERATGRPLTDDEQATLLKKRGHPWLMASRYLPQQQLIGPALLPLLPADARDGGVLGRVTHHAVVGGAINAIYADDSAQLWARVLGAAWNGAIYSVGIVTLVFAVLEKSGCASRCSTTGTRHTCRGHATGRAMPRSETVHGPGVRA